MSHCPPNGRDPNPRPMQRGRDGLSAYQVWVNKQPYGADTSWCAYMQAITGMSAYEDWASRQPEGADTSWDAFMEAISGEDGEDGVGIVDVMVSVEPVEGIPNRVA